MIFIGNNNNLFTGKFEEEELKLYEKLTQKDIDIILEYQELLPVLQQDNNNWINARELHKQLNVGRDFTTWIKQQLEDLDAKEGIEFTPLKGKTSNINGGRPTLDYFVTVETAKEIAMVAGAKGGNTNSELKERSKIARKYFIAMEKAFESRYIWNKNRKGTIDTYHDLKKIVFKDLYSENKLNAYIPDWWNEKTKYRGQQVNNTYAYELYLLDLIIIGMSASRYRQLHNIPKNKQIRRTFNEQQLADFEMLQSKSAEYLEVNNVWDTNKRFDLLKKFYDYYKNKEIVS